MASNPNTLKTLTKAILEKRCVAIRCEGKSKLITIEPHAVYIDSNSNFILDYFQQIGTNDKGASDGVWNSIAWRKINSVFWLNTAFTPRINQGFEPVQDKYKSGLIAIVDINKRSKVDTQQLQTIESSIDQILASQPSAQTEH